MIKNCSTYGKTYPEEEIKDYICTSPYPEKQERGNQSVDNTLPAVSLTTEGSPNTLHPEKSKTLAIIGVITVIAILISASCFTYVLLSVPNLTATKYYIRNDGPKMNFQSSLSGSFSPVLDQGYYTTYGYYYQGNKIGSASIGQAGNEYYRGVDCFKTKTTGTLDINIKSSQVKFTFESIQYTIKENNMPCAISSTYQYQQPASFTQTAQYEWDHDNKEMRYTITNVGTSISAVCSLPEEYWTLLNDVENIQVGYSKELTYTMDMDYLEPIEVTMNINVIGQEDVNVANGEYSNCNIIELVQTYELFGTKNTQTMVYWVTSQGIMPQAEITISSGIENATILLKLDEYYTTTPLETSAAI